MIGIVGGVGPAAGADLLSKITEETAAHKDQEHLPVLLYSLPHRIVDRTAFLEGKEFQNPGINLAEICLNMEASGVCVAGIPCNTAHAAPIFSRLEEELKKANSQLTLVHLIHENINYLHGKFKKGSRIGVLSTTGTFEQKIYSSHLEAAGYACILPDADMQKELVHTAIYHPSYGIKSVGRRITDLSKAQLYHVMDLMKKQGAEAIILGCTEIPLAITENEYKGMLLIDATRVLARAMIRHYDAQKLKEDEMLEAFQS
ncbi:aspartate racemase [Catalinimonas alkaloidigena]|uniref:aspartate/glutamate racemase family protein n=1 Tax=Catalinimonas alkaloidigena TaxID=1075417 RepID=UPI0024056F07|nr:amino acid racemase [Catalinimonas alkaloidigena]MDF9795416.1 aspartate racemase [Catalinimonas alkaloidigena]